MALHDPKSSSSVAPLDETHLDNSDFSVGGRRSLIIEVPTWEEKTGNLIWFGQLVLHLDVRASAERALLGEFESHKWRWVIENPLEHDGYGGAGARRRDAVHHLNCHQGQRRVIDFFSQRTRFVAWCPSVWMGTAGQFAQELSRIDFDERGISHFQVIN